MPKGVKAKFELGVNSIMDPVMVPEGFGRVCDGLELRSGVARPWQLPTIFHPVSDPTINCIWEYRGLWFYSKLFRTYHGEYIQGQAVVYFDEEGVNTDGSECSAPQKVINGKQYRLGIQRPLSPVQVLPGNSASPTLVSGAIHGSGGINSTFVSYRIAAIVNGATLQPSDAVLVTLPQVAGVVTPSSIKLEWRKVPTATQYAIFGRTEGAERLITTVGNTSVFIDDGSMGEGSDTAAAHDALHNYQYVYTYYRNIDSVKDESGPSPLSANAEGASAPILERLPQYDGLYTQPGVNTYKFPGATANTITASIASTSIETIHYAMVNTGLTATMYVTDIAHGMLTGALGRLSIGLSGVYSSADQVVTIPYVLNPPTVTLDPVTPYPAGGTVTPGAHTYKFTAVRGAVDANVANPAQTLATTVVATVPGAGQGSASFVLGSYTSGTDAILVYRDGVAIAFVLPSATATFTDTGAAWPSSLAMCSVPSANETATRCFQLAINSPLGSAGVATFQKSLTTLTLTGTFTGFAPVVRVTSGAAIVPGDTLFFSGMTSLSAINGPVEVVSYNSTTKVLVVAKYMNYAQYNGVAEASTAATMAWTLGDGGYSGWRIYRVGDTAEFLLVADLPMTQTEFTDLVGTDNLGIAIPTAYVENGLEVVFDWAPRQSKRMVNHYGMRFAIVDGLVRWTPTNLPDAWPDVYYAAFPALPVALASFKTMIMVLCQDGLYGLSGNTPSTLGLVGPLSNLGCIAPFSVQASNYGIMWLSKTGICISQDGVSAMCLTSDRVAGRYFYAPSTPAVASGIPIGDNWWMPTTQSTQFAESMSQEKIDQTFNPVNQVTADLPVNAEMTDLRSFYWNDRYCLYASGVSQHARMGTISIDMHSRGLSTGYGQTMSASGLSSASTGLPITTIPVKPVDVHVSMGGDCYMLLQKPHVTTVVITSPV